MPPFTLAPRGNSETGSERASQEGISPTFRNLTSQVSVRQVSFSHGVTTGTKQQGG